MMFKKVAIVMCVGLMASACVERSIPKKWRPITVEEKALKWAVRLCHQFGYAEETEERRKCIARRYDQYIMENS